MIVNGFALIRDSDQAELAWWQQIPSRIDIPGTALVVFAAQGGWSDQGYSIVARQKTVPDPPPARILVSKAAIVDRLQAAGKLAAARAALDAADLYTRERWNTRGAIYSDDAAAIALLRAIGTDPAQIMAPE